MLEKILFKKEIYAIILRKNIKVQVLNFLHQINFPSNLLI